uniref:Helicase-associated domain-containing protein n=1 Tax=Odontella aurita TaxID=265563 RepID=A0A7S4NGW4_9STRA
MDYRYGMPPGPGGGGGHGGPGGGGGGPGGGHHPHQWHQQHHGYGNPQAYSTLAPPPHAQDPGEAYQRYHQAAAAYGYAAQHGAGHPPPPQMEHGMLGAQESYQLAAAWRGQHHAGQIGGGYGMGVMGGGGMGMSGGGGHQVQGGVGPVMGDMDHVGYGGGGMGGGAGGSGADPMQETLARAQAQYNAQNQHQGGGSGSGGDNFVASGQVSNEDGANPAGSGSGTGGAQSHAAVMASTARRAYLDRQNQATQEMQRQQQDSMHGSSSGMTGGATGSGVGGEYYADTANAARGEEVAAANNEQQQGKGQQSQLHYVDKVSGVGGYGNGGVSAGSYSQGGRPDKASADKSAPQASEATAENKVKNPVNDNDANSKVESQEQRGSNSTNDNESRSSNLSPATGSSGGGTRDDNVVALARVLNQQQQQEAAQPPSLPPKPAAKAKATKSKKQRSPPPETAAAAQQKLRPPAYGTSARRSAEWEARLEQLIHYKKEAGNCRVPKDYPKNPSLASWCDNQRRQRKLRSEGKKSSMTDEREAALDAVDFWWGIGRRIVPFEDRLEELKKYRDEHGTCRVTQSGGDKYHDLREWLSAQRTRYFESRLDETRIQILKEAGVDFGSRRPKWSDYFRDLLEYKAKFGDIHVSAKESPDEYRDLAKWCDRQRSAYTSKLSGRASNDAMSDERYRKLRDAGFAFSNWDVRYDQLVHYKERRGCLPSAPRNIDSARILARKGHAHGELIKWLVLQRDHYQSWKSTGDNVYKGTTGNSKGDKVPSKGSFKKDPDGRTSKGDAAVLTDERVLRLLKLGFDFRKPLASQSGDKSKLIVDTRWKSRLGELKAFRKAFGHCDVPPNFAANRELYQWSQKQRDDYVEWVNAEGDEERRDECVMTEARVKELQSAGFAFDVEDARWESRLIEWRALKEKIEAKKKGDKPAALAGSGRKKGRPKKV